MRRKQVQYAILFVLSVCTVYRETKADIGSSDPGSYLNLALYSKLDPDGPKVVLRFCDTTLAEEQLNRNCQPDTVHPEPELPMGLSNYKEALIGAKVPTADIQQILLDLRSGQAFSASSNPLLAAEAFAPFGIQIYVPGTVEKPPASLPMILTSGIYYRQDDPYRTRWCPVTVTMSMVDRVTIANTFVPGNDPSASSAAYVSPLCDGGPPWPYRCVGNICTEKSGKKITILSPTSFKFDDDNTIFQM